MNAIKHIGRVFALVALGVVLISGATSAEASMHLMNWTVTEWSAGGNGLNFSWDTNSQYDLVDFAPTVQEDQIGPVGNPVGSIYEFVIPNFYDPLPKKTVEITLRGTNSEASGLGLATVLNVFGADSPYGEIGPAVPAPGKYVSTVGDSTEIVQLWNIFPNPDFDYVKIWAPTEFGLDSIKIVTQSVPLPASVLLLGSALAGLVVLRRRKR